MVALDISSVILISVVQNIVQKAHDKVSQYGSEGKMRPFLYNHKKNRAGLALYMVAAKQLLLFSEDMHFEHYITRYAPSQFRRVPKNIIKCDMENVYAKKNLVSIFL